MILVEVAATARLTRLVVEDELTRPIRDSVEERCGSDHWFTYVLNCPYCVSVWAGLLVQFLPRRVVLALALSSGVLTARWLADAVDGIAR